MLNIVQIPKMCLLNNILGIYYYVAHKHQESKVQLRTEDEVKAVTPFMFTPVIRLCITKLTTKFSTSNLKKAMEPPKIEAAKCSHKRMERPEESRPPRYKNSRRLAIMAAAEKQPKATAQPTKALTTMLQQGKFIT